jgi:hypothetical protein
MLKPMMMGSMGTRPFNAGGGSQLAQTLMGAGGSRPFGMPQPSGPQGVAQNPGVQGRPAQPVKMEMPGSMVGYAPRW